MKLLILNALTVTGGVERVLERYTGVLIRWGHEVVYAVPPAPDASDHLQAMVQAGARTVSFPDFFKGTGGAGSQPTAAGMGTDASSSGTSLRSVVTAQLPLRIRQFIWQWRHTQTVRHSILRWKVDEPAVAEADTILLCAGHYEWLAGAVAALRNDVPRLAIRLGNPPEYEYPTIAYRRWIKRASPLCFVSRDTLRQWKQVYFFKFHHGRVLPTPIPVPSDLPPIRWPDDQEVLQLLCLSRLTTKKGIDLALQAVARLKVSGRNVHLSIAGDGMERMSLTQLTKDLDIVDQVDFLGHVGDVDELLNRSHVLMVPSRSNEGLPNSLLQGMAHGLPVIGAAVGGTGDMLGEDDRGICVPPESIDALVAAVERLFCDPSLREGVRNRAHAYMRTNHDVEPATEVLLDFLNEDE